MANVNLTTGGVHREINDLYATVNGIHRKVTDMYTTQGSVHRRIPLLGYDPILNNNSWQTIAKASADGIASILWSIGDVKYDALTGDNLAPYVWEIAGFGHDDLSDGSGKAGITFISKDTAYLPYRMNATNATSGGFVDGELYTINLPLVAATVSNELRSVIKPVTKLYSYSTNRVKSGTLPDFWIPATIEWGLTTAITVSEGSAYPLYTSSALRRRYAHGIISSESGFGVSNWTRTLISTTQYETMYITGSTVFNTNASSSSQYVCLGMCI